jgi:hypothetical protein
MALVTAAKVGVPAGSVTAANGALLIVTPVIVPPMMLAHVNERKIFAMMPSP